MTSSTRFPNPLLSYEDALLRRDTRTMARAAEQLTRKPVTVDSIRALNAQLGLEVDDEVVAEVARAR